MTPRMPSMTSRTLAPVSRWALTAMAGMPFWRTEATVRT